MKVKLHVSIKCRDKSGNTIELCSGTEVERTGEINDDDDELCVLKDDRGVWIETRYLF